MSDNVFAPLEDQLQKSELEAKAAKLLTKARSYLLLGRRFEGDAQSREAMAATVFFSTIALRMQPICDWSIPTMATDGRNLFYNPAFVAAIGFNDLIGVQVHEVLHVANKHHVRCGEREPGLANIAMDLAINHLIKESGLKLPEGALFPGERPKTAKGSAMADAIGKLKPGLSFEEYYAELSQVQRLPGDGGEEEGEEGQDPGGCGGVVKPGDGSESARRQAEAETEILIVQAQRAAMSRGTLPAGLARLVASALEPTVDWRAVLRDFVSRFSKNDYCWARPNRRFVSQGLIMPGMRSEELGDVVIAVDTSGSITDEILAQFAGEIQSILSSFDVSLTIIFHDSEVAGVQLWKSSDGPIVLAAEGGGGTDHRPVFEWIAKQNEPPTCLVCLTDMCSSFPETEPDYPVLWASTIKGMEQPFGQLVDVVINE